MSRIRDLLFRISPEEVRFERRGFRGGTARTRARIEQIGRAFLAGYHAAVTDDAPDALAAQLALLEGELRGFAYEGAGMALALLDALAPWRRDRFAAFVAGPGAAHVYMCHIGAGWAWARLPWRPARFTARFQPSGRALVLDGYGFHEGFFHWPEAVEKKAVPAHLRGAAREVFDQGLGRGLWFVEGADVERVARTVATFPEARRGDLWSGVGLAATYAGGVERADLESLRRAAAGHAPALAQGAAFAAAARVRAGNLCPHSALGCEVFCGRAAADVAATSEALLGATTFDDTDGAAWQALRARLQARLTAQEVAA